MESRTQYSPLIGWRQGQEGDLEQAQLLQLHGALQLLRRGPEPLQQDGPAAVRGTPAAVCRVTGSRDRPRQGGFDGRGKRSCKCNYVDMLTFTVRPSPHADTAWAVVG